VASLILLYEIAIVYEQNALGWSVWHRFRCFHQNGQIISPPLFSKQLPPIHKHRDWPVCELLSVHEIDMILILIFVYEGLYKRRAERPLSGVL